MSRWILLSDYLAQNSDELGRALRAQIDRGGRRGEERPRRRDDDRPQRRDDRPRPQRQEVQRPRPPQAGPWRQGAGPGPMRPGARFPASPAEPEPPAPEEAEILEEEEPEDRWFEDVEADAEEDPNFSGPGWSKALDLSPNVRVQAKAGFRAVLMPLRPGLAVVAEVPEGFTQGFGAVGVLGSLVLLATRKALQRSVERPEQPGLLDRLLQRREANAEGDPALAGTPSWASKEDLGQVFGCDPNTFRDR